MRPTLLAAMALVGLAELAQAQALAGVYRVDGTEPTRGTFTGTVELRWTGAAYSFSREVEFTTYRHQGRPVSTAWGGIARDRAGGVDVELSLDRMGWIAEVPGLPPRTAADGVPMAVRGTFTAGGGGALAGSFTGQGPPFDAPSETWTRTGPPAATPAWKSERLLLPAHRPPTAAERRWIFSLFATFHATAWVAPYASRPEFLAAQCFATFDRTDQDLHRRRPDLLRVVNRLVDPIALEEAKVKANALGRALRTKAEAADLEVPQRFTDPSGAVQLALTSGAAYPDGDGCLWTGVYALSQALRAEVTQDPAAVANVERTVRALWAHMAITGRPDEFARTLRAAQGPGGSWQAGTGAFAGTEWLAGGNNDMFKGLILGAVSAHAALNDPAHAALRADYAQALAALAQHHPVAKGGRRSGNAVMVRGSIALLDGTSASRDEYRRKARNPLHLLSTVVLGGGLTYLGQADWSGTHLNLTGLLSEQRMAAGLSEPLHRWAVETAMRRAAVRLAPVRRSLHALAAAAHAGLPHAEAQDGVQALRELPFPRAEGYGVRPALRGDFCLGPMPNLPWKFDWTRDPGRARGIVMPALFEQDHGNYLWKNVPYESHEARGTHGMVHPSTDYLIAYWLARKAGLIGPAD